MTLASNILIYFYLLLLSVPILIRSYSVETLIETATSFETLIETATSFAVQYEENTILIRR